MSDDESRYYERYDTRVQEQYEPGRSEAMFEQTKAEAIERLRREKLGYVVLVLGNRRPRMTVVGDDLETDCEASILGATMLRPLEAAAFYSASLGALRSELRSAIKASEIIHEDEADK